jgi:Zn-dependent protease
MRNLLTWSLPLGHLFGIPIRIHVLFPVVVLGLILREVFPPPRSGPGFPVVACILMGLLFVSVLLHELGHCYGARLVDGEAREILLWPLGGLAFMDVPHTPRANFIAAAAGPAVNVLLCLAAALFLIVSGFRPSLNPLWDAYRPQLYNWKERANYASKDAPEEDKMFVAVQKDALEARHLKANEVKGDNHQWVWEGHPDATVEPLVLGQWQWQTLLGQLFWINYILFLLNVVLIAFPMDGGRMFQCLLWPRLGFRQSMLTTIYAGFVVILVLLVYAVARDSVLALGLAGFIFISSGQQLILLETGGEESVFGYDFSQGYTSLERDRPPQRRRPSFWQRWKQRRAALKLQREQEQREAEERRMDELLEKVQHQGLQSLTDEERRFLTRVSAKYRNRP